MERDWTPRRLPGGIFCSPACGGAKGFCKQSDHDKAHADARKLAAELGDGWTVEVWENLGWHWRVNNRKFEAHREGGEVEISYSGSPHFEVRAKTSDDALGLLRQDMRTFIRRLENELADAA